jgi:hypothetical protein
VPDIAAFGDIETEARENLFAVFELNTLFAAVAVVA